MTKPRRVLSHLFVLALLCNGGGCAWYQRKFNPEWAREAPAPAVPAPAVAPAAPVPSPSQSPATVAQDFYEMHQRLGSSGLPNAGAANAYAAFVCPGLATLMASARERQQRFIADHPGDKPPLVEGDLFSSLFEGADAVTAVPIDEGDGKARVQLDMRHGEGSGARRWTDVALMAMDDGAWCLDDVQYGGKWPFANTGRLRDQLQAEF